VDLIDEVWIEDSEGNKKSQWLQHPIAKGTLQLTYPLGKEPKLGHWKILFKVGDKEESTTFEVTEYVLPKFELNIEPPTAVLMNSKKELVWKICSTFLQGNPVPGLVNANLYSVKYEHYSIWRRGGVNPMFRNVTKVLNLDGSKPCGDLKISPDELSTLTSFSPDLNLEVTFQEDGTADVKEAKWSGRAANEHYTIQFGNSPTTFIAGGFSYAGDIKLVNKDETPRANELLRICVNFLRDDKKIRDDLQSNIYQMPTEKFSEYGSQISALLFTGNVLKKKPIARAW